MIYTIDSDDEIAPEIDEDEEQEEQKQKKSLEPTTTTTNSKKKQKNTKKKDQKEVVVPSFQIEFDNGDILPLPSKRFLSKKKKEEVQEEDSPESGEEDDDEEDETKQDKVKVIEKKAVKVRKTSKQQQHQQTDEREEDDEDEIDAEKGFGMDEEDEEEFFDEVIDTTGGSSGNQDSDIIFAQLNLSRPFLRAIEALGYTNPTPIQIQVIPFGLAGRDICASAVTGSGKTAAFLLPSLERLLYRPKDIPAIRVLVITPTRELATQIYEVLQKLSQFTDISSLLVCGGKRDLRTQEAQLKQQPDIVICTPGRMLDHLRNSLSITLDYLNILILDEVDRLLELGFQDEVKELINYCPNQRQTMLFSATMTPKIEDLVKLSLKRPLRIKTDSRKINTAARLIQEFIKVKGPKEKEAILLALIHRTFHTRTIVFFELKKSAQRFCGLLNLAGIKAVELHGDLPQIQRYMSLESFRNGEVEVLVATDVAARGIDIPQVQTVINAEMPRNISIYIHRVGRTARAGCGGRSITLVSEERRKIMKEVLKEEAKKLAEQKLKEKKHTDKEETGEENQEEKKVLSSSQILSRNIPSNVITTYLGKITVLEGSLAAFLEDEKQRRQIDQLEREAERTENLLLHEEEIQSRPARTWFQTETQKKQIRSFSREKIQSDLKALSSSKKQDRNDEDGEAEEDDDDDDDEEDEKGKDGQPVLQSEKQLQKLALLDDYRIDESDKANKKLLQHRVSRKKRRRLEAIEASREADAEDNDHRGDDGDDGDEGKKRKKPTASKSVKQVKNQQREKQMEKLGQFGKSAGELTMKKITVVYTLPSSKKRSVNEFDHDNSDGDDGGEAQAPRHVKKRTKVVRQTFAIGGFDQDIYASSSGAALSGRFNKKKKAATQNEIEEWKEFDPNKRLRKGGKIGSSSFKSKKKYKRRK